MNKNSEELWTLNNLPLTEMIGDYDPNCERFDQSLMINCNSAHVYLKNIIPSDRLYNSADYSYRTESSPKTKGTINRFLDFFEKTTLGKKVESIVDIGGNDLTLAKFLKPHAKNCYVIDPVCSTDDGKLIEDIHVIGKKIEEVNLRDIDPNIISCRHTIEHIENPKEFISQLFDQCPDDCTYVFEIPDFDCLVEGMRFDAVFHQHLHYFSLNTISNLITECGGEVIDYEYNFQGSCGGALFIAFKKTNKKIHPIFIDIEDRKNYLEKKISHFQTHMNELSDQIEEIPKPIYGYGAGLMLATYAYHLKTDFSFIETILDDDLDKHGKGYINLPVKISHPSKVDIPDNSSYLITSLENIRPIYIRLQEFLPRRILAPFIS